MIRYFASLALLLVVFTSVDAQILPFRTYSIENGLSEAVVNDLVQDQDDYLWVATSYGLNRFDGISFRRYYTEDGLLDNQVHSVYVDRAKRLWIGTASGVNVRHADSITVWPELEPLQSSTILAVYQDKENNHWFATDGEGVWHLDPQNNLTQYTEKDGLGSNRVRAIAESEEGVIWFATRGGLTMHKDGAFRTYTIEDGLPDNRIRDVEINNGENILWVGSREGLCEATRDQVKCYTEADGLINNRIQSLTQNSNGNLWIGTEEGVSVFKNGNFKNYSVDEGLANNFTYTTYIDREKNVWLGTFGGGFSLFLGDHLKSYTVEEGLPNNVVTTISGDSDSYWIGTYGGGIANIMNEQKLRVYNAGSGLVDDKVYTIRSDGDKQIIGTRWGISIFEDGQFSNYDEKKLPARKIRAVLKPEGTDELWLGTYGEGIIRFNKERNTYSLLNKSKGLVNNMVLALEQSPDGAIWVATYGGVSRWKDGEITNYTLEDGLPNNGVLDILIDNEETLWFTTYGGIAYLENEKIISISPPEGLPEEVCYFIEQDERGIYWIGTNNGVVRFDFETFQKDEELEKARAFKLLTIDQGLIANDMNQGASYKDDKGNLWFGSVGGVTRFDPTGEKINTVPPALHIDNVFVAGDSIPISDHIEIASDNHNVTFEFIGISFSGPEQVQYRYRLKNSGEGWQRTTERSARYSALGPGDYIFEVQARNNDGYWTAQPKQVHITVLTPFWQQWWFIGIIFIVLVGIILFIYNHYRIRKMVEMERMRVRIASDLHDDVGSALTEIALQSDFLQTFNVTDTLKESLNQIGQQSRKIVSSLDDIVWSIDARNDTLGDLTDRMQDYAGSVLSEMLINYHFEGDMNKQLPVPVKENLYLIFKEAINNISKHADADKVDVNLSHNGDDFTLIIKDNGKGSKNSRKSGQGLRNIELRAKRIDAVASFSNKDGFTVRVVRSD